MTPGVKATRFMVLRPFKGVSSTCLPSMTWQMVGVVVSRLPAAALTVTVSETEPTCSEKFKAT